jgi:hypothetical protein
MSAPEGQPPPMGPGDGPEQTEEELRAALEEELRRITVRDVLVQTVVSLINLSGQRLGLGPDGAEMRDLAQVRLGIEGVRALLPLLEQEMPEQVQPVREALSQLQLAYARETGGPAQPAQPGEPEAPEEPPPPRRDSGLWVPPGS